MTVFVACDNAPPRLVSARGGESGVFLVEVDTGRREMARALIRMPGVWGVQEIPPRHVIFRAPAPLSSELHAVLAPAQLYSGKTRRRELPHMIYDQLLAPRPGGPAAPARPAVSDALVAEDAASQPRSGEFAPQSYARAFTTYRTSEVFVGSTAIVLLLPESNGTLEASTEDWTADDVSTAVAQVAIGLSHAQAACKSCRISFVLHLVSLNDAAGAVSGTVDADYESINHPFNDLTVNQNLLAKLGYPEMHTTAGFRQLANDIRARYATDWAVVIKVGLDKTAGGRTWGSSGLTGVSYLGGPLMAVTYMNTPLGTSALWATVAHELNHSFYATDEYASALVSPSSMAGYFKVANAGSSTNDATGFNSGAGEGDAACIMAYGAGAPSYGYCAHTQGQVGWWDDDADGIPDIIDAPPVVTVTAACGAELGAAGEAYLNQHNYYDAFPAYNMVPHGVGVGSIARVEYRIDRLTWLQAIPQDGAFDGPHELYSFALTVPNDSYAIEVRAVDAEGNKVSVGTRKSCAVTTSAVANAAPFAAFTVSPTVQSAGNEVLFDASASTDREDAPWLLAFRWDFNGDGQDDTEWGPAATTSYTYSVAATLGVRLSVRDSLGAVRAVTQAVTVSAADLSPVVRFKADRQVIGGTTAPEFQFSAAASTDPEGTPLAARWDFDGDGDWDTPLAPTLVTSHTYTIPGGGSGAWSPAVEVRDGSGNISVDYLNVRAVAYNHAPSAAFSMTQQSGNQFLFNAGASSDPDQGTSWDGFLEYRWDFDGDGKFETTYSAANQILYTFSGPGSYAPTVEVRDRFRFGARLSKSLTLNGTVPTGLTSDGIAVPLQPTLAWNAVAGAAGYEIQLGGSLQPPEHTWRVDSNTALSPPLLNGATVLWRVTALTGWAEPLGFSAAVSYHAVPARPWVTEVQLAPAAPRKADGISLSYTFHGVGRPESETEVRWYLNGTEQVELQGSHSVTSAQLSKHDTWYAVVQPGDGSAWGAAVTSATVEVENSPPAVTQAVLSGAAGRYTCLPKGWSDADADKPGYRFAWVLDDQRQAGEAELATDAGKIRCEVTPFDGEEAGSPATSTTLVADTDELKKPVGMSKSGCGCRSAPASGDGLLLALVAGWWVSRLRLRA